MRYGSLIKKMSLEEKARLCVGKDFWHTNGVRRLGVQEITMSDGPHGVRFQVDKGDELGINKSEISTCFPALSTIANSWDRKIAYKLGDTLGKEAKSRGIDLLLGPAVNIKRTPLCGRNFEYFSEDPYLTGKLATEYVKGLQSNGVGACVKHYAVNNQENKRRTIDAIVDERTLREIYLKAFEMIVKDAEPVSIMSAYNKVNGTFCSENKILLDILREEWGFDGIVISDWGAENDIVEGVKAGNDIEMPGGNEANVEKIIEAVKEGTLSEETLNNVVSRILDVALSFEKEEVKIDYEKEHQIAEEIAREAVVLLKNEDDILPIKLKKVALIGEMARDPKYQGAGSSFINSYKLENGEETFKKHGIEVEYAKGYSSKINNDDGIDLLKEAVEVAKRNEIVIVYVGLKEGYESEGIDRWSLYMPLDQDTLIKEIAKVNPNVVVVLSHGSPVVMPWKDNVKAIITGYLGGEAGEKAIAECILGIINPNGKLAETFPDSVESIPCANYFPGNEVYSAYKEGIFVGYRYYDTVNTGVLYPFGYGLSYTNYKYSNIEAHMSDKGIDISFTVENTGSMDGKEIVEIYISHKDSKMYKAPKELKWFEKFELKIGEAKNVNAFIPRDDLRYYDIDEKKWKLENGIYEVLVGKSSQDIVLCAEVTIDDVPETPRLFAPTDIYTGKDIQNISNSEFEKILRRRLPKDHIDFEDLSEEHSLENFKNTRVGKALIKNQKEKMNELFDQDRINIAIKVMMDLQKPIKKFYEKANSPFTKEMVDEFIYIAKHDLDYDNCEFYKTYIKQEAHW